MIKQHRDRRLMTVIGRRLREAREACGLSQEKVLFQTGIYVSHIESGERNISVSTLIALCQTYQIKVRDFFIAIENDEAAPQ